MISINLTIALVKRTKWKRKCETKQTSETKTKVVYIILLSLLGGVGDNDVIPAGSSYAFSVNANNL